MTLKRGYTPVLRIIQRWRKTPYWRRARRPAAERGSVQWRLCLARHRRHTAAVHLLEAGVEINIIRAWLGHVSLDTTHRYAEITVQMKAQALEACEPGRICALSFRPV